MNSDPDLEWYLAESERKSIQARCPFATCLKCPRYFQSLSLLGEVGLITKIPSNEESRLMKLWSKSDLWPLVAEQGTSISGNEEVQSQFENFCPEVSYDTFNYFASHLVRYSDEIDKENIHKALMMTGSAIRTTWRWSLAHIEPLHYSNCTFNSLIGEDQSIGPNNTRDEELFELKPSFFGFSLNLKSLYSKLKKKRPSR